MLIRFTSMATLITALAFASAFGLARSAFAGGTCHEGSGVTDERSTQVTISGNCFRATVARIDAGATVTFLNKDDVAHTVTGAAFAWGNDVSLGQGDSVTHTFTRSGVYPYSCLLHPGMVGAIVVGDGSGSGETQASAVLASGIRPAQPLSKESSAPLSAPAVPASSSSDNRRDTGTIALAAGLSAAVALAVGAGGTAIGMRLRGKGRPA